MSPTSTYRLQIRPSFDLDAAAGVVGYLRDLGVGWAYLSPLLQATTGSDHGYDVVDPSRVDPARGGGAGLDRFAAASRSAGLGILVDIVPNHMGISLPQENPWWWDVLTHGRGSRYAEAFDIDWEYGGGRVRVPILGVPLDEALADIRVDAAAGVVRYFDHVLPLAPGSLDGLEAFAGRGPDAAVGLRAVLDRQHWELMFWRDEASELNYRRFFAVSTLAGVRVEVPAVFEESHAEILRWVRDGLVDGLRVDHPDGLADPGGYLERLAAAARNPYVLVEKILEHAATDHPETLPAWWEAAGTTGYDAMAEIDRVLVDPSGREALDALDTASRGGEVGPAWGDLIHDTKRMIADTIQVAEVRRLVRSLPGAEAGAGDADPPAADADAGDADARAEDALAELLACFPTYRPYAVGDHLVGRSWLDAAASEASARRPDLAATIAALVPAIADPALEVSTRFAQTTGPVMAKGVEDTAFYRYTRLGSLTEVGGDPSVFALSVDDFHRAQERRQSAWPYAMTSLSTHDTKRGEDVRARLAVLAELPRLWTDVLGRLRSIASTGHGPFDNLLWQAIVGSWPARPERLHAYAEKAAREAAEATGWWDPDVDFERRMHAVVDAAYSDAGPLVDAFVDRIRGFGWSNSLSAKLLQLAGPGVPDVYQGSELWETSLVDPDNRRAVDFARRADLLRRLDEGWLPPVDESGAAKLLVVSRALRLRRDHPDRFDRYTPVTVAGSASAHAVAFDRGGALAVATRLPAGLAARGGWGDTVVLRRGGPALDVLTGRRFEGAAVPLGELLGGYPVALLVDAEVLA
ncbi:malto-oligosyltrehalose synthase [Microbacterium sp.]|uniref:malto-oligosyltrehalose synthase n=1 Tax=Microbacterium sp. TaxID=51671 RepID=UPI0009261437|nr:malto-oligosyltrehalose synthase [Microbacterium sp.]MBN9193219.1 malto-oligosyltrehalose synthase [Microbacterium sp.]OJU57867.1 MAG: malto-oligosyltrehalose synthase [Microbacterium sp. 70-38]